MVKVKILEGYKVASIESNLDKLEAIILKDKAELEEHIKLQSEKRKLKRREANL